MISQWLVHGRGGDDTTPEDEAIVISNDNLTWCDRSLGFGGVDYHAFFVTSWRKRGRDGRILAVSDFHLAINMLFMMCLSIYPMPISHSDHIA